MATVTEVNICRVRGDTDSFTVSLVDASAVAIDLTGSTVVLTVDPSNEPGDALANLFTLTGALSGTPTDGVVTFTLTALDADQVPETYFYDVEWTNAGGVIKTVLRGTFTFEQDITK